MRNNLCKKSFNIHLCIRFCITILYFRTYAVHHTTGWLTALLSPRPRSRHPVHFPPLGRGRKRSRRSRGRLYSSLPRRLLQGLELGVLGDSHDLIDCVRLQAISCLAMVEEHP